jgi:methyltransferase (TIGR00027 family)
VNVAPRSPSRTAVLTAAVRALHRDEPPPRVLDDDLASLLAGVDGDEITRRLRTEVPPEDLLAFSRWLCVRARLPEDLVQQGIADGVRQYVILGAGLDSFAHRRGDLLDRLHVFEVDHPATQAWKRLRLQELGIGHPANLIYAAVDFETQTLRDGLVAADFDFGAPAIFSWIGVTMYLTKDAIMSTLETVHAAAPKSRIILTYNRPVSALRSGDAGTARTLRQITQEMGEPFISLFEPAEIEQLLIKMGFVDVVHFGPNEAVRTYFQGRSDIRLHGSQYLVIATVPG